MRVTSHRHYIFRVNFCFLVRSTIVSSFVFFLLVIMYLFFYQIIYKTFLACIVEEFKYLSGRNSFLTCWRGGGNFFFIVALKRALPIYPWLLFAWQNNVIFEWIIQLIVCCCFFSVHNLSYTQTLRHLTTGILCIGG